MQNPFKHLRYGTLRIRLAFCFQLLTVFLESSSYMLCLVLNTPLVKTRKKHQSPVLMFFITLKLQIKIINSEYKYRQ